MTSHIDKEYLEAEFNRLNRECDKVAEEIKYLERVQKLEKIVANKERKGANTAGATTVVSVQNDEDFKSNSTEISESGTNHYDEVESNSSIVDEYVDRDDNESICQNNESEIEADLKASDNVFVPAVTSNEAVFESVTESIVANKDLVHKPEVVDANVIILEPQPKATDCHDDQNEKSNNEDDENERKTGDVEEGIANSNESATKLMEENKGEAEKGLVGEDQETVKEDEEVTDINQESSESDNGVMKELVNDFQQKLKLDSESDC